MTKNSDVPNFYQAMEAALANTIITTAASVIAGTSAWCFHYTPVTAIAAIATPI